MGPRLIDPSMPQHLIDQLIVFASLWQRYFCFAGPLEQKVEEMILERVAVLSLPQLSDPIFHIDHEMIGIGGTCRRQWSSCSGRNVRQPYVSCDIFPA